MNHTPSILLLVAGSLAGVGLSDAAAQMHSTANRFYLTTDFGASLIEDINLRSFTLGAAGGPPASGDVVMQPGLRFDASAGYEFGTTGPGSVSVELASGVVFNRFDRFEFAGGKIGVRGDLYQIPLFGNVIGSYKLANSITPYVGGGGGAIVGHASIDNLRTTAGALAVNDSDTDITPAIQAFAGVRFDITDTTSIGLAYKFLKTFEPEWTIAGAGVRLGDIHTHAVSLTLSYRF
jgi:opacity protein-like surface antigen